MWAVKQSDLSEMALFSLHSSQVHYSCQAQRPGFFFDNFESVVLISSPVTLSSQTQTPSSPFHLLMVKTLPFNILSKICHDLGAYLGEVGHLPFNILLH